MLSCKSINTIYGQFYRQVCRHPDLPAVITSMQTHSFRQLADQAARLAAVLPQDTRRIGVVVGHSPMMIALLLAILKNGAAYIPAEPSFPTRRIVTMLDDARADLLITDQDRARFDGLDLPVVCLEDLIARSDKLPADPAFWKETPEDLAYILYTSGTTGRPKGVMISSANVCHYARAFEQEFHTGPGDVMLQYSVCSFDIFTEEVFTSLLNGAAIAIPDENERSSLPALMCFVQAEGVTIISGFPYLLDQLNRLPALPDCLRLLISGGDVLRETYISRLRRMLPVYNTYGPSETTVCAAYCDCSQNEPLSDCTFPIGHPVAECEILLLDDQGDPVPDGEPGEICILGQGVGLGYAGDHPIENQAFTYWKDGARMYRSGDIGRRLPDGQLAFLHRRDDQVMILGRRVEPAEVQNALSSIEGIADAVVHAYFDPSHQAYLIGYVILNDPALSLESIRQGLSALLPSFMIPEFIVRMSAFPYNDHGKIDTRLLPVVLKEGRANENR